MFQALLVHLEALRNRAVQMYAYYITTTCGACKVESKKSSGPNRGGRAVIPGSATARMQAGSRQVSSEISSLWVSSMKCDRSVISLRIIVTSAE